MPHVNRMIIKNSQVGRACIEVVLVLMVYYFIRFQLATKLLFHYQAMHTEEFSSLPIPNTWVEPISLKRNCFAFENRKVGALANPVLELLGQMLSIGKRNWFELLSEPLQMIVWPTKTTSKDIALAAPITTTPTRVRVLGVSCQASWLDIPTQTVKPPPIVLPAEPTSFYRSLVATPDLARPCWELSSPSSLPVVMHTESLGSSAPIACSTFHGADIIAQQGGKKQWERSRENG